MNLVLLFVTTIALTQLRPKQQWLLVLAVATIKGALTLAT